MKRIKFIYFFSIKLRVNDLTKVLATVAMLIALAVGAIAGGMAFKTILA